MSCLRLVCDIHKMFYNLNFTIPITLGPIELLQDGPITLDGNMAYSINDPRIQFGGSDFSLVANVMTGMGGTIVSKARATGGWKRNCKSLFIDLDGLVKLSVGGVGYIQSRTRVNDGQQHEVAVDYIAAEQRYVVR